MNNYDYPRELCFAYTAGENLRDYRVILLESVVMFPDVLERTIKWLQDEGAQVEAVAVLFMRAGIGFDESTCNVDGVSVISANSIDFCACDPSQKGQHIVLSYEDY